MAHQPDSSSKGRGPYDAEEIASNLTSAVMHALDYKGPWEILRGPTSAAVKRAFFHAFLAQIAFEHKILSQAEIDAWDKLAINESPDGGAGILASAVRRLTDPTCGPVLPAQEVEAGKRLLVEQYRGEEDLVFRWALKLRLVDSSEVRTACKNTNAAEDAAARDGNRPQELYCPNFWATPRGSLAKKLEVAMIRSGVLPGGVEGYLVALHNIRNLLPATSILRCTGAVAPSSLTFLLAKEVKETMIMSPFFGHVSSVIDREEMKIILDPDTEALLGTHKLLTQVGNRGSAYAYGPEESQASKDGAKNLLRAYYHLAQLIKYKVDGEKRARRHHTTPAVEAEVQFCMLRQCLAQVRQVDHLEPSLQQAIRMSHRQPNEVENSRFWVLAAMKYLEMCLHLKGRLKARIIIAGLGWADFKADKNASMIFDKLGLWREQAWKSLCKAYITSTALGSAEKKVEEELERAWREQMLGEVNNLQAG